jgi:hypothetical protein
VHSCDCVRAFGCAPQRPFDGSPKGANNNLWPPAAPGSFAEGICAVPALPVRIRVRSLRVRDSWRLANGTCQFQRGPRFDSDPGFGFPARSLSKVFAWKNAQACWTTAVISRTAEGASKTGRVDQRFSFTSSAQRAFRSVPFTSSRRLPI